MFSDFMLIFYTVVMIFLSSAVTFISFEGLREKDDKILNKKVDSFIVTIFYICMVLISWFLTASLINMLY